MKFGEFEIPIKLDDTKPNNEVRFVDKDGKELGKIINIGQKDNNWGKVDGFILNGEFFLLEEDEE